MYVSACTYCVSSSVTVFPSKKSSVTVLVVQKLGGVYRLVSVDKAVGVTSVRQYYRLYWQLVSNDPLSNSATVLVVFSTSSLPCAPKNLKKTKYPQNFKTKISYLLVLLSSLAQSNLSSIKFPSFFKTFSPQFLAIF